jgi:hypothetical protein
MLRKIRDEAPAKRKEPRGRGALYANAYIHSRRTPAKGALGRSRGHFSGGLGGTEAPGMCRIEQIALGRLYNIEHSV